MRLFPFCLPLVLAPLIVAGQQAQPATSQKPAQTGTTAPKSPAPHKSTTYHRKHHRHARKTAAQMSAKHAGFCSKSQMDVIVINGAQPVHVCMDKAKIQAEEAKATPGQMKVQVINGSASDTQYFSQADQETARNQPVVVGVESSDTRYAGGNKNPVVTGVVSSSTVDAKTASSGGQPVTKSVAPRPKRPAYQPESH